jgi:hypothetical protein
MQDIPGHPHQMIHKMNGAINKLMGFRAVLDGVACNHITDANERNAYCFRCVANEARSAMQDIPGHPHQMIHKMNESIGAVCKDLLQQNILQLWAVIQRKSQWGMGNWDKNGVVRQPRVELERLYLERPQLLKEPGQNIKQQLSGLIPEILRTYDAPMYTDEITRVVLDLLCLQVNS